MLNRFLTGLFALVLAIQLGYLLVGLASLPGFYQRVTHQTVETSKLYGRPTMSNAIIAEEAAERGLSLEGYALYRNLFNTTAALIPTFVALLIVWRARWQWFAWFTAAIIVFLGSYTLIEQTTVAQLISQRVLGLGAIFWFLVLLFFFLFPNGQIVPRRVGWLVLGLVVYHFFIQVGTVLAYVAPEFAAQYNLPNWGNFVYVFPVLLNFLIILGCQIYRYRYVSTPIERQQTKWFLLGFGLMVTLIPVSLLTGERGGFLDDVASKALYTPLPVMIAIAVLRYRLWDIDILIRRTLQYSVLSGLLALVYFGLIVILQGFFTAVSGQASPVATVLSTLAIAALFLPLRRRVQAFIDKRFFRQKYDAQKVLTQFAATCRDETDLDQLTTRLVGVMHETMQPESMTLWLVQGKAKRLERNIIP